jgi:hypothetical protein
MRRFMVHLVTEIDFVDGDDVVDEVVQNYEKHLAEMLQNAAKKLSLRAIRDTKVVNVQVAEIKTSL